MQSWWRGWMEKQEDEMMSEGRKRGNRSISSRHFPLLVSQSCVSCTASRERWIAELYLAPGSGRIFLFNEHYVFMQIKCCMQMIFTPMIQTTNPILVMMMKESRRRECSPKNVSLASSAWFERTGRRRKDRKRRMITLFSHTCVWILLFFSLPLIFVLISLSPFSLWSETSFLLPMIFRMS